MNDTPTTMKSDLIMDIPVSLTVELGRTQMKVKDIMSLSSGTVIELEKAVDEPVDLYVNGKLIARGEVVTIEDNIGIKITQITQ